MGSRDEFYRLAWSEPMTKIADRFDVSGSYLARVCTPLNLPRPEGGYWAKLADPLDIFRAWKAPEERYSPRYASEERTD